MRKFICLLILPALALLMCGCAAEKELPEETAVTTASVTENLEYVLVRSWTNIELMNSIFYCGEYRPLPLVPDENEGFSLSEGTLIFPDGSFASAATDENGSVTALTFKRNSAPRDFSVWGIGFNSVPDDIPDKIGIADSIYGDKEETITYSFYGGGIRELTFVYTEKSLTEVRIGAEV